MSTGRARWPYRGVTARLWADKVAGFLERPDAHEGAILVRTDNIRITLAGQDFDLGPVQLHCPHMILSNLDELRASDPGGDPQAVWRCAPGEHLTISSLIVDADLPTAA